MLDEGDCDQARRDQRAPRAGVSGLHLARRRPAGWPTANRSAAIRAGPAAVPPDDRRGPGPRDCRARAAACPSESAANAVDRHSGFQRSVEPARRCTPGWCGSSNAPAATGSGSSSTITRATRRSASSSGCRSWTAASAASGWRAIRARTSRLPADLHHAQGDAAVMMAADLQDPPETIDAMIAAWRAGAQVVWAARRKSPSALSAFYYWVMRRVRRDDGHAGQRRGLLPGRSRRARCVPSVSRAQRQRAGADHVARLPAGVRRVRQAAAGGRTVGMDARPEDAAGRRFGHGVLRPSHPLCVPTRRPVDGGCALVVGVVAVVMLPSVGAVLLLLLAAMFGLTGVQLLALGVVGEYVWRALDESRRRPHYLIERIAGRHPACPASAR